MKIRRAVFIVVYAQTKQGIKYLILKRKLHWKGWEFPKGGIEKFELRRFTIRRELKEETGLKPLAVKSFREKGIYKYDKEHSDRQGVSGQEYKLYAVKVPYTKKIKFDKLEHSDYRWFNFSDAVKKLTWANQKKCLRIVNESLNK